MAPPYYEDSQVEIHRYVVGPIDNNVFVLRCKQTGAALLALYAGQRQAALGSLADPTTDAAAGDGAPPTSDGNDSIEPEHGASPNGGPARH